jgi:6-phosphogluconolactonase
MSNIFVFQDAKSLSEAVAEHFVGTGKSAINIRRKFSVALAGGSTPQGAYKLLATPDYVDELDWTKVHIFWGDERCVPPDDVESNYRMAEDSFIKHLPIPAANVYRMEGERNPGDAAENYQARLLNFFGDNQRFDLVLLGMGNDGHTASLFPGKEIKYKPDQWVAASFVEKLSTWRLTLTPSIINLAHRITFIVSGGNKADTLSEVIQGNYQPGKYPSQLIKPADGILSWYIDKQAARKLKL